MLSNGSVSILIAVLIALGVAVVAAVVGFFAGVSHRKRKAEAIIGSAENESKRILNDAYKAAEAKKKESILEAKDEIHNLRTESEKEIRERRNEVKQQERRLTQKEESLDHRSDNIAKKEELLSKKLAAADAKTEEVEQLKKSQLDILERISGFSIQQAKDYLLKSLEDELTHEKAIKIMNYEQQVKEDSEKLASKIIAQAIQRCAADHSSEVTISVIDLPSDEMKGRIIGREGRNIRTFEQLTGVDLIIDDTPGTITLSSFDPIRREVARIALERLITDGRIHPARIEEMVEKARREVDRTIKQEGENAVLETGIHNLNPELVMLLGRLHYSTSTRALRFSSASRSPRSAGRARRLSTLFTPTTARSKPRRSSPVWFRLPTLSRPHVRVHAAKMSRTMFAVLRSSRKSRIPSTELKARLPFRQAARSA